MYHTSVSGFVAQQHLHLPVLLQRLQQDVALLVEEEEDRQGDVVCVAAVPCHLKQGSGVAAAALVVVWKGAKGDQWEIAVLKQINLQKINRRQLWYEINHWSPVMMKNAGSNFSN